MRSSLTADCKLHVRLAMPRSQGLSYAAVIHEPNATTGIKGTPRKSQQANRTSSILHAINGSTRIPKTLEAMPETHLNEAKTGTFSGVMPRPRKQDTNTNVYVSDTHLVRGE